MAIKNSRRGFIKTGAAVAAGVLLPSGATAIEPIKRTSKPKPKFKFSLAGYSYRDLFKSKKLSLKDFVADCAKFDLEGTELTSPTSATAATSCSNTKKQATCARNALATSTSCVRRLSERLRTPALRLGGRKTTPHRVFGDCSWHHELQQILGATGFGAGA